jgi:hypothetical protein
MGLFSKKSSPEPVRRDQVLKLVKLGMRETDAADRDIDSQAFDQAKIALDGAYGKATKAEIRAAHEALRRHGY